MDVSGVFSRRAVSNGSIARTREWATRYALSSSERIRSQPNSVPFFSHALLAATPCIPWYRDSSLSSLRNLALTSAGNSAGLCSSGSASGVGFSFPAASVVVLSSVTSARSPSPGVVTSDARSGVSTRGVPDRLEPSSSPIANSASNSLGSGPRVGVLVPVFRRGRERWPGERLLEPGRREDLEREMFSCAAFWRACSSAIRESMASRKRWGRSVSMRCLCGPIGSLGSNCT